jgi:hypothetical protein
MKDNMFDPELDSFEQHLGSVLNPVTPRAVFINSLYALLVEPSPVTLRSRKVRTPLWVILGVISGIVLILSWLFGLFKHSRLVKSAVEHVDSNKVAQNASLPISQVNARLTA